MKKESVKTIATILLIICLFLITLIVCSEHDSKQRAMDAKIQALEQKVDNIKVYTVIQPDSGDLEQIKADQYDLKFRIEELEADFKDWNGLWNALFGKEQKAYLKSTK